MRTAFVTRSPTPRCSEWLQARPLVRDLERDLNDLELQYEMSSDEFFQSWQAGEMADTADFMDWNALYQMVREVRERLELLQGETRAI